MIGCTLYGSENQRKSCFNRMRYSQVCLQMNGKHRISILVSTNSYAYRLSYRYILGYPGTFYTAKSRIKNQESRIKNQESSPVNSHKPVSLLESFTDTSGCTICSTHLPLPATSIILMYNMYTVFSTGSDDHHFN